MPPNQVSIEAEALHANKHPVEIKVFPVGVPSDGTPFGAMGKRILVPNDVAERDLPTLRGMGIGTKEDLSGHDNRNKIGVIESAEIIDGWVVAKGYLYSYDFPETINKIKLMCSQGDLGASFESTQTYMVNPPIDGVWVVKRLTFTGLALMDRQKAAWTQTSVEAAQENSMADSDPGNTTLPTINDNANFETLHDAVLQHGTAINSISESIANYGNALIGVSTSMQAMNETLTEHRLILDTLTSKLEGLNVAAATDSNTTDIEALRKKMTDLEAANGKLVADLQAANDRISTRPTRKTFGPATLLGKLGIQAGDDNSSSYDAQMKQVEELHAKGVLSTAQSMAAKMTLREQSMTTGTETV